MDAEQLHDLNADAVALLEKYSAGAVFVVAVVMGADGRPFAIAGSTGVPNAMALVASTLPRFADFLEDARREHAREPNHEPIRFDGNLEQWPRQHGAG